MHEASLVRSLLEQVEQLLREHGGAAVEQITVQVGPLSGVEPLLVLEAFQRLAPDWPAAAAAALEIEEVALEAECGDCGAGFEIHSFRFQCPVCGSQAVRVIRGDEFRLLSIGIAAPNANPCQA
jgi:hydrogenase nickel incorporation protein HypA/HybF